MTIMRTYIAACIALLALCVAQPAMAQANGQQLFEENCAVCHQSDGTGNPPAFPALAGDANLSDLALIVNRIHSGWNNMPPFPDMTAEEIAAIASYIRTSWGNNFGEVTADEVSPILGSIGDGGTQATIWDGVYTDAQAERGKEAYKACTKCHGSRLNGAPDDPDRNSTPPLARVPFLRDWDGRSLATLFEYTRATMPQSNPGYLSDEEYIDIIAYMLKTSNMPAGDQELTPDPAALAGIVITQQGP